MVWVEIKPNANATLYSTVLHNKVRVRGMSCLKAVAAYNLYSRYIGQTLYNSKVWLLLHIVRIGI